MIKSLRVLYSVNLNYLALQRKINRPIDTRGRQFIWHKIKNTYKTKVRDICSTCVTVATKRTSPPQSHLGTVRRYPSRQRMHSSAACAGCAMSTADKCSYSAAGTLYIHSMILHQSLDTSVPNHNLYHNSNPTYRTNPSTVAGYRILQACT